MVTIYGMTTWRPSTTSVLRPASSSWSSRRGIHSHANSATHRRLVSAVVAVVVVLVTIGGGGNEDRGAWSVGPRPALAIEAKWTPAEGDGSGSGSGSGSGTDGSGGEGGGGGGPLPLSQNQRNQLLQLEGVIANSPDPSATLMNVARQNGMEPSELADLLSRNRKDMEMAGVVPRGGAGGGGGRGAMLARTLPRRVMGVIGGLAVAVVRAAASNPRRFGMVAIALTAALCVAWAAPRTGVVLSTGPIPLLSSGYTTFLPPPSAFVHSYLESTRFVRSESTLPRGIKAGKLSRELGDILETEDDEEVQRDTKKKKKKRKKGGEGGGLEKDGVVLIEELGKRSGVAFAITARKTVHVDNLLPDGGRSGIIEDDSAQAKREFRNDVIDAAHIAAISVISSRRFTEFADGRKMLRFYSGDKSYGSKRQQQGAALVAKSMGDFGRFGMQPLRVAYEEESHESETVAYHTLDGGHFDGEICFSIRRLGGTTESEEEEADGGRDVEGGIVISVSIIVPKDGRMLNRNLAESLVVSFVDSIHNSIVTQAKQTLARRSLSDRYRGRASGRAAEKRHINYETEKKLEEMAEDRRRRWQRANPDAGRYRPSGHRMRSPNNC